MKRAAIVCAVLALVAAGCTKKEATPPAQTQSQFTPSPTVSQTTPTSSPLNDHGTMDVAGKQTVEVELDDFYFKPTVLKGTAGQSLKIELKNEGAVEHNFSLTAQNISQDVEKGETKTVTVAFPSAGSVDFFCKYHVGSGMRGSIAV